jgi:hypothetical protein
MLPYEGSLGILMKDFYIHFALIRTPETIVFITISYIEKKNTISVLQLKCWNHDI